MKLFVLALCIVSAAAFGKRCRSAGECNEGECCVNYWIVPYFGGFCRKLREEGQYCTFLKKIDEEKSDMYHFLCPCKEGLDCRGIHDFKIIHDHVIIHKPECVDPGKKDDKDDVNGDKEVVDEIPAE